MLTCQSVCNNLCLCFRFFSGFPRKSEIHSCLSVGKELRFLWRLIRLLHLRHKRLLRNTVSFHSTNSASTVMQSTGLQKLSAKMISENVICAGKLLCPFKYLFCHCCIVFMPAITLKRTSFDRTFVVITRHLYSPQREEPSVAMVPTSTDGVLLATKSKAICIIDGAQYSPKTAVFLHTASYTFGTRPKHWNLVGQNS